MNKWRRKVTFVGLVVASSFAFLSMDAKADSVPVYRSYNPNDGLHHYTKDKNEYNYLDRVGWESEGIAFYAETDGGRNIYRSYNSNDGTHNFTPDKNEYNYLDNVGWQSEGVAFKAATSGIAVYRAYNPNSGEHFYTTNPTEYNKICSLGWQGEDVAWYSKKQAQLTATPTIGDKVDALASKYGLWGGIALVKDNKVIYSNYYGYQNKAKNIKNSASTLFPIASISKVFTATIISQLVAEGKMTYNDTINKFEPNMPNGSTTTIRELLTHTSGFDNSEIPPVKELKTDAERLAYAKQIQTQYNDNNYRYSNNNFVYLALIASKVTGKSFQTLLQERIYNRVGLKNTYLYNLADDSKKPVAYNSNGTQTTQLSKELMSSVLGAGDLYCTLNDLAQFSTWFMPNAISSANYNKLLNLGTYSGGLTTDAVNRGAFGSYTGAYARFYGLRNGSLQVVMVANKSKSGFSTELTAELWDLIS